jgi:hypothetical protein
VELEVDGRGLAEDELAVAPGGTAGIRASFKSIK